MEQRLYAIVTVLLLWNPFDLQGHVRGGRVLDLIGLSRSSLNPKFDLESSCTSLASGCRALAGILRFSRSGVLPTSRKGLLLSDHFHDQRIRDDDGCRRYQTAEVRRRRAANACSVRSHGTAHNRTVWRACTDQDTRQVSFGIEGDGVVLDAVPEASRFGLGAGFGQREDVGTGLFCGPNLHYDINIVGAA
jgi:hypothetical protein